MSLRRFVLCGVGLAAIVPSGCLLVPRARLAACHAYNCELQRRNQEVCAQYDNLRRQNEELANRSLDAEERLAQQEGMLGDYQRDRDEMYSKFQELSQQAGANPLPREVRRELADFAQRHPQFVEVDAELGIAKFNSDVLFPSGEAELSAPAQQVLSEFAEILRGPSAESLNVMVVGHTDSQRVAKPRTKQMYGNNWNLSTARANAVIDFLQAAGIRGNRLGAAGFGPYQPLVPGNRAEDLAKNRRVEIYVMAPDAPIVGRTDGWHRR